MKCPRVVAPPNVPHVPPVLACRERSVWLDFFIIIYRQGLGMCIGYLALGIGGELLRRSGIRGGAALLDSLDLLPYLALRALGLLDVYIGLVAAGQLSPFACRVALSSLTVVLILAQATIVGLGLAAIWRPASRALRGQNGDSGNDREKTRL